MHHLSEAAGPLGPAAAVRPWSGPTLQVRSGAEDPFTVAAWWWDADEVVRPGEVGQTADVILGFCLANGVNELYLDLHFSQLPAWGAAGNGEHATREQLAAWIGLCHDHGIRVSALTGAGGKAACAWLDPARGFPELAEHIRETAEFNRRVLPSQRLYGVHFDLEPDCGGERPQYLYFMYRMLHTLRALCDRHGLQLEFDLNAWYSDADRITDDEGHCIRILDAYTTLCDSLAIMSYRPTAAQQLAICRAEWEAARKNGCRILLGCETGSAESMAPEERIITYAPCGTETMYAEQRRLRQLLEAEGFPAEKAGIAVHWTDSWYQMAQG